MAGFLDFLHQFLPPGGGGGAPMTPQSATGPVSGVTGYGANGAPLPQTVAAAGPQPTPPPPQAAAPAQGNVPGLPGAPQGPQGLLAGVDPAALQKLGGQMMGGQGGPTFAPAPKLMQLQANRGMAGRLNPAQFLRR